MRKRNIVHCQVSTDYEKTENDQIVNYFEGRQSNRISDISGHAEEMHVRCLSSKLIL